jgi:hypothetical protein
LTVLSSYVHDPSLLTNPYTSEGQAFEIVSNEQLDDENEVIKRYSMLSLYFASNGEDWVHSNGWRTHSSDVCKWYGAGCEYNALTKLSLGEFLLVIFRCSSHVTIISHLFF